MLYYMYICNSRNRTVPKEEVSKLKTAILGGLPAQKHNNTSTKERKF